MQIKILNKILERVKKEEDKKFESEDNETDATLNTHPEARYNNDSQANSLLQPADKSLNEELDDVPDEEANNTESTQGSSIKTESKNFQKEPVKKKKMESDLPEETTYFSQRRRILNELRHKKQRRGNKASEKLPSKNYLSPEKETDSRRFILRESRLIKKSSIAERKTGKGISPVSIKKERSITKNTSEIPKKKNRQLIDRDSTLFVISTLNRLISQEKLVNADAETESIFEVAGKKMVKSRNPLTRRKVEELKNKKFGTRYPLPGKKVEIHPIGIGDYNLKKTVEKAEEIYRNYRDIWE